MSGEVWGTLLSPVTAGHWNSSQRTSLYFSLLSPRVGIEGHVDIFSELCLARVVRGFVIVVSFVVRIFDVIALVRAKVVGEAECFRYFLSEVLVREQPHY